MFNPTLLILHVGLGHCIKLQKQSFKGPLGLWKFNIIPYERTNDLLQVSTKKKKTSGDERWNVISFWLPTMRIHNNIEVKISVL